MGDETGYSLGCYQKLIMKITVCEIGNEPEQLSRDWKRLAKHVQTEGSDVLILPEMPFYPWPAWTDDVDLAIWEKSVKAHDKWVQRLPELSVANVLGTRPTTMMGQRKNEGFVWHSGAGYRPVHTKYYLPEEEGFRETAWYERGPHEFIPAHVGNAMVGFLICTELWFMEHARSYGQDGVHLLACPRATPAPSKDKWLAGGRTAAVVSGAFCLSSNFGGTDRNGMCWAGNGWIIEPEEGRVMAVTSPSEPFITIDIDLRLAEYAKQTYPRYVQE
jgi:N-carbamoylputrescine amidase